MFYDCHCHLDLYENMNQIFENISKADISVITMTTTPKAWKRNYNLAKKTKNIYPALGLHPQLVYNRMNELALFQKYVDEAKFIGEIGIDASDESKAFLDKQIDVFTAIIKMIELTKGKVISLHSRKAEKSVLDIVGKELNLINHKIILHWYSGSISNLKTALEMGCFFSINRRMTLSKKGTQIIESIPLERILIESDSPFINKFSNSSELISELEKCVKLISNIKKNSYEKTVDQISMNQENII